MKNNDKLKKAVEDHWNETPMHYDVFDKEFGSKPFFEEVRKKCREINYYGQNKHKRFWSNIIDYSYLKGKKVLEIGCGMGVFTANMAEAGAHVTAVDLTQKAVDTTKKHLEVYGLKATVKKADAEHLPFADESFDFVASWGVIHHTPNTQQCIKEIYRVLKPGGRISIMIYCKNSFFYYGPVLLYRGIIQGRIFKKSKQNLLNMYTDHSQVGGTPLAKCYRPSEAKKMFKKFKNIKMRKYGLKDEIYFIKPLRKLMYKIPRIVPDALLRFGGWHLMISGKK